MRGGGEGGDERAWYDELGRLEGVQDTRSGGQFASIHHVKSLRLGFQLKRMDFGMAQSYQPLQWHSGVVRWLGTVTERDALRL